MTELVGHHTVRSVLKGHRGSFALLGPSGVGRRAIAQEWASQQSEEVTILEQVGDWSPYLRVLEEGKGIYVIIASELPPAVLSRVPVFRVGYLSDKEVMEVITQSHPRAGNKVLVARLSRGSVENLDVQVRAAGEFGSFEKALEDRACPNLRAVEPMAIASCVRSACASVMGGSKIVLSPQAKASITPQMAKSVLNSPAPKNVYDARNLVTLFFSSIK